MKVLIAKANEDYFFIVANNQNFLGLKNVRKSGIIYGNDFITFSDIKRFRSLREAKDYLRIWEQIYKDEDFNYLEIFLFTKK